MNMKKTTFRFSQASVDYHFDASMADLTSIAAGRRAILVTDEHVHAAHPKRFKGQDTIVLKPGEEYKVQPTVDAIVEQLIKMEADRKTLLVGVGGGVVTDMTGYAASVYMRGIPFGFVPTSLLAMVDASIGGKNGIDVGPYKNMVGVIRQPSFLLYDMSLLKSLPDAEWSNGFAEIIKHACIKDAAAFALMEKGSLASFKRKKVELAALVERNARLKSSVVVKDEFETGDRKLLNFGHTLGHALETQYELSHGQAISIGMGYASRLSARLEGFKETDRVVRLLEQYGLPTDASFNWKKVLGILRMDKKRVNAGISYVLLKKVGKGILRSIPLEQLELLLQQA
jgi:3-dehydroquinate synthase